MVLLVIFVNVVSLDWVNKEMISPELCQGGNDFSRDRVSAEMISAYTESNGKYTSFLSVFLLANTKSTQK